MTEEITPWDAAVIYARKLEEALLESGYREGSCSGDWSEKSRKWQILHEHAQLIVKGLKTIITPSAP